MDSKLYLLIFLITVISVIIGAVSSSWKKYKEICMQTMKIDLDVSDMIEIEDRIEKNQDIPKRNEGESAQDYIWRIARSLRIQNGGIASISKQAAIDEIADNTYQVFFQRGLSKEKSMFALAHECGHILNGDHFPNTRPDTKNKSKEEQLADYAGVTLLLPKKDIENFLFKNKYEAASSQRKWDLVKSLCNSYEVSPTVVLRRIEEVSLMMASEQNG